MLPRGHESATKYFYFPEGAVPRPSDRRTLDLRRRGTWEMFQNYQVIRLRGDETRLHDILLPSSLDIDSAFPERGSAAPLPGPSPGPHRGDKWSFMGPMGCMLSLGNLARPRARRM